MSQNLIENHNEDESLDWSASNLLIGVISLAVVISAYRVITDCTYCSHHSPDAMV